MQTFDIAVIGMGAVGAAAIYQLSKADLSVVGIDKYSPPHTKGSSHGESRITRQAVGEGAYYSPLAIRADEIWKELERATGQELYNPCGLLIICNENNDFFNTTVRAAHNYSIKHEMLDRKEIANRFPAISSYDGEVAYYEPTGGFLRPERCIEAQLRLAEDGGAELLRNTEVTSIREVSDGVVVDFNGDTGIKASKVILAQGPWISDFLPSGLKRLFKTLYQTLYWFDFDKAYLSELSVGKMPVIMCSTEQLEGPKYYNFYGFPVLAGKSGGIKFGIHDVPPEVDPDKKDEVKPVTGAGNLLYKNVSKYVSHIKPKIARSMNCVYTVTPDEDFIIDYAPGSGRVIIASPCSGHGFKHSAATGEILSQLATEVKPVIDISSFSLSRF